MIERLHNVYVIICDSIYLKAIDLVLNIGNWTYLWKDRVLYVQTKHDMFIYDINMKCGLFQKCLHQQRTCWTIIKAK